jgi:hypothetical protein
MKMARPIEVQSSPTEAGALSLSLSLKSNKILKSFKYIVRYSFGHKYANFANFELL